jgi:hypothetical protein
VKAFISKSDDAARALLVIEGAADQEKWRTPLKETVIKVFNEG